MIPNSVFFLLVRYHPAMGFEHIRDQEVAVRLVRQVLARGRFPNGMLFWGPAGVGKETTALALAMALNCTAKTGEACGECLGCRKVGHGTHPDVKVIGPSGKTREIKVASIDFMTELASYRPFEGAWRVFLIQDADRMRIEAQNHFLKTLEEPPSATMFVLLSEFPRRLLPTIRSRCQQARFGALRLETVEALLLERRDLPQNVAAAIAAISQGQMSRALDFVDTGKRDAVIDMAKRIAAGEDPLALAVIFAKHLSAQAEAIRATLKEEAPESDPAFDMSREEREDAKQEQMATAEGLVRRDIMEYMYLLAAWYRDVMVLETTGDESRVLNRDHTDDLRRSGAGDGSARIAAIEKAWLYIERNLNMERVFRDLFFALAPVTTPAR